MPPPNVTGSLHIGHALDITLQDVLTRRERMLGKDALWVVGTDHAGIATQMVVERNLDSQGIKRAEIGREAFLEHVWEWKATVGRRDHPPAPPPRRVAATGRTSASPWTRASQRAVTHVFVELYKRGLLYRDKRLVNWDPKFQTAISDLEVETRDVQGKFWTLRYPLADGSGAIQVATTRPETMLADMAVAVHPDDERYTALIGKQIKHPITGRLIPIVADEHADPELGSGAVKITPGHDFNDFEVGKRAGFKPARHAQHVRCRGARRADAGRPDPAGPARPRPARKRASAVVELLEDEGALVRVEDRVIPTPYGDRSGVVIEPWLTDQWYVDAAKLARPAIQAARKGDIKIVPETWEKTWFNWLENIQPWCVSRQLWWGHRIPAWYAEDGNVFVAETEEEARAEAGDQPLRQDEDVLDTWFSLRPVAVRHARLARADRGPQAPLPQRRAHLRLRHPVLLGRADGDAGHRVHGRGAVEDALPPRPGPRRARAEDVQVEGQHGRPARPDRQIWRRRAALHAGGDGKPGPRHQAR